MKKSINDLLLYGQNELKEITENNVLDAKLLLSNVLDENNIYLFMNKDKEVSDKYVEIYKEHINRRKSGEPLQYITSHQEFMGLDFFVAEGVLIPRGDTEVLVETVIEKVKDYSKLRILDIGTGSGAIHVSLAHFLKDAELVTVDISTAAIEIAKKNAKTNNVYDRIRYYESDLFSALDSNDKFDVVVSNPPYIPTEVIDGLQIEVSLFEPMIALDGGKDGYNFYRRIITDAKEYLTDNGILAFEVGHDQARTIQSLLDDAGYSNIEIYKDLNNIERVVIARYER